MDATNQEIVLETVERQYHVDMLKALEKLEKNPEFKKVILEGYLQKKALSSVSLLARQDMIRMRPMIIDDLVATSTLNQFFLDIKNLGRLAEDDLDNIVGEEE
jgi:hypothetical protein